MPTPVSVGGVSAVDPLDIVQRLADCLYNKGNLSCIPQYCAPNVVVHGDGVFLPHTSFVGVGWASEIHRQWFAAYTSWRHTTLEAAATRGVRGFTDVFMFFRWTANNTGSYRGQTPSGRVSRDYGVLRVTTDKAGRVTDVTLWRAGFQEDRDALLVNATRSDLITPRPSITGPPFWIPSQSLQLKMLTRAHALLEVMNQGEKFLDGLDDIVSPGVELIDGTDMWDPPLAQGVGALKLWVARWLQAWGAVSAADTGSAPTQYSNKVFLCFRLLLTPPQDSRQQWQRWRQAPPANGRQHGNTAGGTPPKGGAHWGGRRSRQGGVLGASGGSVSGTTVGGAGYAEVDGCLLFVFNINGFITHIVVWRNGTPDEAAAKFIGGRGAGGMLGPAGGGSPRRDRLLMTRPLGPRQHPPPALNPPGAR